ncbi:ABC transporter permease [Alkaliphilus pronyensis]|uniref:ABC transporter permease n=1 Tax=Alkaliphilus pronyensis TaxID=1482732 RepID=A0A6I0F6V8_9FIRM|nr:ABC transporter permease [Alkaliphilus pronyensis]KAB3533499.1 ABC transporter permease [Alkaliphilus pronyensis]
MLKGLMNLFKKDMIIALRNSLFWVLIVTLILMIGMVRFLIPDEIQLTDNRLIFDNSQDKALEKALLYGGLSEENILQSEEEVIEGVRENSQSIGIIYEGSLESPRFTVVHHGKINPQQKKLIDASLKGLMSALTGTNTEEAYQLEFIRPQAPPISKKLTTIPTLLVFEVLILGFMYIALFMFQEKEEGSIRAYRISPGNTSQYILSKTLVFTVVGLVYGFSLVLLTVGTDFNFLYLALTIVLGSALYTFLGGIVGVFFNNISEWFAIGVSLLVINMIPIISSLYPAFSPKFVTYIPSYSILLIFNEILFPTGKQLFSTTLAIVALTIVAYIACHLLVENKLMKEGR